MHMNAVPLMRPHVQQRLGVQARKRVHAVCTVHKILLAAVVSSVEHLQAGISKQVAQSRDVKTGSSRQESQSRLELSQGQQTHFCMWRLGQAASSYAGMSDARPYSPCSTVTSIASVHLHPASLALCLFSSWLGCASGMRVLTATVTACWAVHLQHDSRNHLKCCVNAFPRWLCKFACTVKQ